MIFTALLAALAWEHFRPLGLDLQVYRWFGLYANLLEHKLNAGEHRHGVLAWFLAVLPFALMVSALAFLLNTLSGLLGWLWSVFVLYALLGFGSLGSYVAELVSALRNQHPGQVRMLLEARMNGDASTLPLTRLIQDGIEDILSSFYKKLFGIIFWFALLGPAGALVYRFAQMLAQSWGDLNDHEFGRFGAFSTRVMYWLDWVPTRLYAISFAIVGDFEEAVYSWRLYSRQWMDEWLGIVLSSGLGAIGLKAVNNADSTDEVGGLSDMDTGDDADFDYLNSAVSLIWRTLTLWLMVLLLITLARWTGA